MYSKEDLVSRFFTIDDERQTKIVYELPVTWWSRVVEYCWAGKFANKEDVVLDACSGICHPFKFYLTNKCEKVYVCDIDIRITNKDEIFKDIELSIGKHISDEFDKNYLDKVNYVCCDITNTPYKNKFFNKIFCISLFEHLPDDIKLNTFKEYNRILKDDGMVIITADYPNATHEVLLDYADKCGFKMIGDSDFSIGANAIKSDYWDHTLYCYRMVLVKKNKYKK